MKKNKIFIYIVLFFALFLIGVKKVSASTYMMCKYTLTQKQAYELGLNSAKKWEHGGYQMFLSYKDGKIINFISNIPDNQKKDNYNLIYCHRALDDGVYANHVYGHVSDWVEIVQKGTTTTCPKILVKYHPESDSACTSSKTKIKYSKNKNDVNYRENYYLSAKAETINLNNTTCVYETTTNGTKKTLTANIKYANGYLKGALELEGNNSTDPLSFIDANVNGNNAVFLRQGGGKYHTLGSVYRNYFLMLKNQTCPDYLYYNSNNKFYPYILVFNGKLDDSYRKGYAVYSIGCQGDGDTDVKKAQQFVKQNYDTKTKKVTATIDASLGKKLEQIEPSINAVQKKYGSGQQTTKCGYNDSILNPFKEIVSACNQSDQCKTNTTKKMAENLRKWSKTLGDFAGIKISPKVDCSILGKKDDSTSLMYVINRILTWIKIAVPIIVIVFGLVDFSKVVVSQDQDALKKATSKFTKRCLVAVIIFFVPSIIMILLGWIDKYISKDVNARCAIEQLNILINYIRR